MLGLPFLYVTGFLAGVFTVCFDVAYMACLPRLVDRDQLAQGNSMLETTRSAAQICGPALGGTLVSLLTAPIAVLASAAFYLVSAVSVGRVRRLGMSQGTVEPRASAGLRRQLSDGLRIVVRDGSLQAIAMATCVYQFSFTANQLPRSGADAGWCPTRRCGGRRVRLVRRLSSPPRGCSCPRCA